MRPRLISKGQARMVADAAGLVSVWTHLADTPAEYARNVADDSLGMHYRDTSVTSTSGLI